MSTPSFPLAGVNLPSAGRSALFKLGNAASAADIPDLRLTGSCKHSQAVAATAIRRDARWNCVPPGSSLRIAGGNDEEVTKTEGADGDQEDAAQETERALIFPLDGACSWRRR